MLSRKKSCFGNRVFQRRIIRCLHCFPNFSLNVDQTEYVLPLIAEHLKTLQQEFEYYFKKENDPRIGNLWMVNPFVNFNEPNNLNLTDFQSLLGSYQNSIDLFSIYLKCFLHCFDYFFLVRNDVGRNSKELIFYNGLG